MLPSLAAAAAVAAADDNGHHCCPGCCCCCFSGRSSVVSLSWEGKRDILEKNERKREVKFSLFGFRGSVGRRGRKKEKSYPASFFSSSLSGLEKYLMSLKYGLQNISDICFAQEVWHPFSKWIHRPGGAHSSRVENRMEEFWMACLLLPAARPASYIITMESKLKRKSNIDWLLNRKTTRARAGAL